ncbi:hypothetical protein NEDG_01223 [Nematocida displodere]|uniref:Uncharacterized protein n=1 Tax=Nematocida displodere TaxID=1805483 RepID=A0A177EAW2_9MICR|nr:hypothetical protein NEDG_01223 [Nematocida displodere]
MHKDGNEPDQLGADEIDKYWESLGLILQMEINDETTTKEVEHAFGSCEKEKYATLASQILSYATTIGCDKRRKNRVIFSSVITGVYSVLLASSPDIPSALIHYLGERTRDVEKKVRKTAVGFVLKHAATFGLVRVRKIAKGMIDLMKNKQRTTRALQIDLICANTEQFLLLLSPGDTPMLLKTLATVLEYSMSLPAPDTYVAKKLLEILSAVAAHRRLKLSAVVDVLGACSLEQLKSSRTMKMLTKTFDEDIASVAYCKVLQPSAPLTSSPLLHSNLNYLLQWGICHRKSLFTKYTAYVEQEMPLLAKTFIIGYLMDSPFQNSHSLYAQWIGEILSQTLAQTQTPSPSPNATVPKTPNIPDIPNIPKTPNLGKKPVEKLANEKILSHGLSIYAKCLERHWVGVDLFCATAEKVFESGCCASAVLVLLEKLAQTPTPEIEELIRKVGILASTSVTDTQSFVKYLNPLLYLDGITLKAIINSSNITNFYFLLWYVYWKKNHPTAQDPHPATPEPLIASIEISKIAHKEFDVSFEFCVLICSVRETTSPTQSLIDIDQKLQARFAEYFSDALEGIRASRECLKTHFPELIASFTTLLSPLESRECGEHKTATTIVARNGGTIVTLLLYLMNSEETYTRLLLLLKVVQPRLPPLSPKDLERMSEYGILTPKTAKKYQRFTALHTPLLAQDTGEISTLTELSISTNLDTNIIEGLSKIEERG